MAAWALLVAVALAAEDERPAPAGEVPPDLENPASKTDSAANVDNPPKSGFNDKARGLVFPKSWAHRRRGKREDREQQNDLDILNQFLQAGEGDVENEHKNMKKFNNLINEMLRMVRLVESDSDLFFKKLKKREKEVDQAVTHNLDIWKHDYEKKRKINAGLLTEVKMADKRQESEWDKIFNKWKTAKTVGEKRMSDDIDLSFGPKGTTTARVNQLGQTIDTSYADLYSAYDAMTKAVEFKLEKIDEQMSQTITDFNKDAGEHVKVMEGTADDIFETGKSIQLSQKLFYKELTAADQEINKMGQKVMSHASKERERTLRLYVNWAKRAEAQVEKTHDVTMKEVNEAELDVDSEVRDFRKQLAYDRKSMEKSVKNDVKGATRKMNSASKLIMTDAKVLEKAVEQSKKNQKKQLEGMNDANKGLKDGIATSRKGTDKLVQDLTTLQDEFAAALDKGLQQKVATMNMMATQNKMTNKKGWTDVAKAVEKAIKEDQAKVKVKRKAVSDSLKQAKKQLRSEDSTVGTLEVAVQKTAAKMTKNSEKLEDKIQKSIVMANDGIQKVTVADVKSAQDASEAYQIKQVTKLEKDLNSAKKAAIQKEESAREATLLYDPDVLSTYGTDLLNGPRSQLAHVKGHADAMMRMYAEDNSKEEIHKTKQVLDATQSKFEGIQNELKGTEAKGVNMLKSYMNKDLDGLKNKAADQALQYILPHEEDAVKSIEKAQFQGARALNATEAKVNKDFVTLGQAQEDTSAEWQEGDELLKDEDKVVDEGLAKARSALTDDVSAQNEARQDLLNDYEVAKVSADRMWEKERDYVHDKYKEAGERMEDQIGEAERLEKQARTEEDSLTARDLRRVEGEEKERVNVMHGDLQRLQEEQKETVDAMHQGQGKLAFWTARLSGVEGDAVTKMMHAFDGVNAATNEMWMNVERGSKEEQALLKGKTIMLQKVLDQAEEHLTDEQNAEMKEIMNQLEADMHTVMRTAGMTDEERMRALADLQHKAKQKMLGIMATSEALAPLVRQFQEAELKAAQTAGKAASELSDEERRQQAKQKYSQQEFAKAAAAEQKKMMGEISSAVEASMEGQGGVLKELRHEDALDAANAAQMGGDGRAAMDGLADAVEGVAEAGARGLKAKASQAKWSEDLLAKADEQTKEIDAASDAQRAAIESEVKAEKNRLKIGVLYTEKSRTAVLKQLADLLNRTQDVSGDLFVQRATAAEQLNMHIEKSLHALEEAGMGDLADMMRNSLAFSKQMLKQMVDLKLVMWKDAQAKNATGEGAEFMKLRDKLLAFQKKSAAESAALVAQLEEKLQKLGIVGTASAEHLAKFLHQMSFQLANGQADGLEDLMSGLMHQFGLALGEGVDSSSILGGTLKALAHKQKVAHDLLKASEKALSKIELRFDDERGRVMGMLSRDQQLQSMSDEEFREHIRKLQELLGNVAATAPDFHDKGDGELSEHVQSALDGGADAAEPAPASALEMDSSTFDSRAQAEAVRRKAAVATQHELGERLHKAILKGIQEHKAKFYPRVA